MKNTKLHWLLKPLKTAVDISLLAPALAIVDYCVAITIDVWIAHWLLRLFCPFYRINHSGNPEKAKQKTSEFKLHCFQQTSTSTRLVLIRFVAVAVHAHSHNHPSHQVNFCRFQAWTAPGLELSDIFTRGATHPKGCNDADDCNSNTHTLKHSRRWSSREHTKNHLPPVACLVLNWSQKRWWSLLENSSLTTLFARTSQIYCTSLLFTDFGLFSADSTKFFN